MNNMNTGGGVAGGSPQQDSNFEELIQQQWQSQPDMLPDQGNTDSTTAGITQGKKTGKAGEKGDAKSIKKQISEGDVDKQEPSVVNSMTMRLQIEARKATGFGYATLSQYELDSLQTGDPILLGHKGGGQASNTYSSSTPPPGSHGIGNPFFNPNPMVAFFQAFSKIERLMKFMTYVGGKLAVQDMKITKETGLAQANATLQAGKAQAKSDETQAMTSLITGALGIITVGMGARALYTARKTEKANEVAEEAESAAKKQKYGDKIEDSQKNIDKLEARVAARKNILKENKAEEENDSITKVEKEDTSKKKAEEKKKKEQQQVEQTESDDLQDDQLEIEKKKQADAQNKLNEKQEAKRIKYQEKLQNEWDEISEDETKGPDIAKTEFNEALTKDEKELKKLKHQRDVYQTKLSSIKAHEKAFKAGKLAHIGQALQNDPYYVMWNAIGGPQGSVPSFLQYVNHSAAAQADLLTAYWKSKEEIYGMDLGIEQKGLDTAIQTEQDAVQQDEQTVETINKMADQETSMTRWSG